MYYELYVDTLFVVNFVMNLYLLMLADISVGRTATRLRLIAASAIGAVLYVVALAVPIFPVFIRIAVQTAGTALIMIKIAFRPTSLTGYKKLLENLMGYSFLLGGGLYVLSQYVKGASGHSLGLAMVMGSGGLLYLFLTYITDMRRRTEEVECTVTLHAGSSNIKVQAILDTGNGLVEPISGKPVSLINESVALMLWPEGKPQMFRAVPFHSVGKAKGILQGFSITGMTIEMDGISVEVQQVYVAVSPQNVSGNDTYEMILNPRILRK